MCIWDRSGAKVTAIELDTRLLEVLDTTLAQYSNVTIVHGDVLKLDVPSIMNNEPFKVVANLPYYITTPIIMSLLESRLPIERLVVMVQKEVALRMVAKPGTKDYGALSAVSYTHLQKCSDMLFYMLGLVAWALQY